MSVPNHRGGPMTAYADLSRPVRHRCRLYSAAVARSLTSYAPVATRRRVALRKPGVIPTVLLVATLLLCHGVLGFTHEVSRNFDGPHPVQMVAISGEHDDGHTGHYETESPSCGHFSAGYFAVVLILVGATMLGFLLGRTKRQRRTVSPPWRSRFLPTFTYLPRGPTLALLQVFRQ